ncbi:MAG TPA: 5-formyltetrahydrofolate cyclo-ligase [Frankiaceae bacterium]|nr:5-formyltetrahydrofolate cyclo-ligase [Frankiaceae bacterium]
MAGETAKAALRKALLAARRERPKGEGEASRGVLSIPEIAEARVVAGYSALRGEPDIGPALEALRGRGIRVLLPVVLADRDLEFRVDGTGDAAALEQADVVLVPALAVDRAGHRLGRGGGSYDRALPRVRPGALLVAIVHPEELVASVPVEAHDIRVGAILAGAELMRVDA